MNKSHTFQSQPPQDFNRRALARSAEAQDAIRRAEAEAEARRVQDQVRVERTSAQATRPAASSWPSLFVLLRWTIYAALGFIAFVPAVVYLGRSLQTTDPMTGGEASNAVMTCKQGVTEAADSTNAWTWLVGGSRFRCTEWDTLEGRKQREAERAEAEYLAKERAKHQAANFESGG